MPDCDVAIIGGGPGGLYFASLMKKADPRHQIRVIERNRPDDTFGFGVVFSDATMAGIAEADSEAYREIARHLVHWDDIEVHYRGERIASTGHGFSGIGRHTLLRVLQQQASTGQFNRNTLVWKNGMPQWAKAGDVPELAPLFANVPPPLPQ